MKPSGKFSFATNRWLSFAALPLILSSLNLSIQAAPALLSDGNSSVNVNPATGHLVTGWLVDGKNQLSLQNSWYRVGNVGGETSIGSLAIVNQIQATSSSLYIKYSNGQFSIETTYSLVGGSAGSGVANLSEQIKITNLGGSALDFHYFKYADFDLTGVSSGDTVQFGQNLQGGFNEALQTKAGGSFVETVFTTGGTRAEAGTFPGSLNGLNDANPTTLNNNSGPVTGDGTWAIQWDKLIAPGSTFIIGINNNISLVPVPEPSALALVPLGFVILFASRRFRATR
jgi:hypothetical protein